MSSIFATEAPKYFARDISVVPLREREKVPAPAGWQMYHDEPIPQTVKDQWIAQYSKGNIGMSLGKQSDMVVIDVDTDDPKVLAIIDTFLPKSPWKRVGQKGYAAAYRYNGTPTFRIKDSSTNEMIVEHLSTRTQIVLPPSIHPNTGREYTANCHLLDVIDDLPTLSSEVEAILRGALSEAGYSLSTKGHTKNTEYISAGARDVTMIQVAGLLSRNVLKGDLTFKQAWDDMLAWGDLRVERVSGDELDITKGVLKIAEFLRNDVHTKNKQLPVGWDDLMTTEEKKSMGLEFSKDDQQWTYEEIMKYMEEVFTEHDPNSTAGMQVVEFILKKVALASPLSMSSIQKGRILNYIKDISGKGLTLANLRQQIREYEAGPIEGTDHTEIAREVLKDLERTSEVRFANTDLYRWYGSHWVAIEEQEIRQLIADNYGNLSAARRDGDHKGILNILTYIAEQDIKRVNITGVNFANGVLTEDGKLVEHNPEFGFTYTLPVRYLPDESHKADKFFKFLSDSWGVDEDYEEKKLALQEAFCATLFGISTRYQRAFCAYGVPKSGKSQLLKIIEALVPEEAKVNIPPKDWGEPFTLVNLADKLVNIAGELSSDGKIKSDSFNMVIAGETMTVNRKNLSHLTFSCKAAHWFGTNHLPLTNDTTGGFMRRWLYFNFDHVVKPEDVVINLGEIIVLEEQEAIIAWAVEALSRLKRQKGYTLPKSHVEFADSAAGLNDSVQYFFMKSGKVTIARPLTEKETGKEHTTQMSDIQLYTEYSNYCLLGAVAKPVGIRIFQVRLQQFAATRGIRRTQGMTPEGESVSMYHGLTLARQKKAA